MIIYCEQEGRCFIRDASFNECGELIYTVNPLKKQYYEVEVPSKECTLVSGKYFGVYSIILREYRKLYPELREGQCMMDSILYINDDNVYNEINGTRFDVFYSKDEGKLKDTYNRLKKLMICKEEI